MLFKFKIKRKYIKETPEQTQERVLSLCYDKDKDFGIIAPPMDAQVALNEIARHLLGSDYYTINSTNAQGNTEIVYDIERKYKRLR